MNQKDKNAIQELLDLATPGVFRWGASETRTYDNHVEFIKGILTKTQDRGEGLHLVIVEGANGDSKTIAITGNGPDGHKNARLLANAPEAIRFLLRQVDALEAEVLVLRAVIEANKGQTGE